MCAQGVLPRYDRAAGDAGPGDLKLHLKVYSEEAVDGSVSGLLESVKAAGMLCCTVAYFVIVRERDIKW